MGKKKGKRGKSPLTAEGPDTAVLLAEALKERKKLVAENLALRTSHEAMYQEVVHIRRAQEETDQAAQNEVARARILAEQLRKAEALNDSLQSQVDKMNLANLNKEDELVRIKQVCQSEERTKLEKRKNQEIRDDYVPKGKYKELQERLKDLQGKHKEMREMRDDLRVSLAGSQAMVNPLEAKIVEWRDRLEKEKAKHSKVENVKRLVHTTVGYLEGRGIIVPPIVQSPEKNGEEEDRNGVWYSFGRRRVQLKFNRISESMEQVLVCVGGGWQELGEYIQRYGVMERQKQLASSKVDYAASLVSTEPGQLLRMMQGRPGSGGAGTQLPTTPTSGSDVKGRPMSASPGSRSQRRAPRIAPGAGGGLGRGGSPTSGTGTFGPAMSRPPSRPSSAAPMR